MTTNEFDVFNCGLDGISLIEASAGTGKTWNICWLYLRLLLERDLDVRQILVVTFTKAATAELRERIRLRIVEVMDCLGKRESGNEVAGNFVSVLEERGVTAETMQGRLEEALQSFDEAAIFTIHGFCQRALMDSAFSSGQAYAVEMLEDDDGLIAEVVHDFWRCHIAGGDMSPALLDRMIRRRIEPSALVPLLKRTLAKPLARSLWPNDADMCRDVDLEALMQAHDAARDCWLTDRDVIVEQLKQAALDNHLKKNIYKDDSIHKGALELDRYFAAADIHAETASQASLFGSARISEGLRNNGAPPRHEFFDLLETLFGLQKQSRNDLDLAYVGLIKRLHDQAAAVRVRKKELRVQSYDDILYNLYDALTCGKYPWLAATLQHEYRAALIDEFQDTDPLQYAIFDAIYGTADCPVFYVGDPKQAIYSFRNADLNIYLKAARKTNVRYSLKHNQRSTEALIMGLNALYSINHNPFMQHELEYVEVSKGEKNLLPFQDASASLSDLQLWMLPRDGDGQLMERPAAMQAAAAATANEIARLLNASANNSIKIGDRPLASGDIAVLVRSHVQGRRIRQALSSLGIGSVELSQQSVFNSPEAEELELVLGAILMPARDSQLRAALATEMIGLDASTIASLDEGSEVLSDRIERFVHYRETWLRHGIGIMLRELMSREGICARMLCRQNGERRMTNLLHLAELLHQAASMQDSPETLLRWFASRRREEKHSEESQLRLESDSNLVQIVTIHKSKGLEYPIVFCPFLWLGGQKMPNGSSGWEYHDDDGMAVIDWRLLEKTDEDEIKRRMRHEAAAETLRLMYVALTRAIYRCYLVVGCYNRKHGRNLSSLESRRSLLNWLVAGNGIAPEQWASHELKSELVEQAWHELQEKCPDSISLQPLSSANDVSLDPASAGSDLDFSAKEPAFISSGWRIGSFSGLVLGTGSEAAASEHDAHFSKSAPSMGLEIKHDPDDILLFPRGANAGNCMHAAFELCDFTDPTGWDACVDQALRLHPQDARSLRTLPENERHARMKAMMLRMVGDIMTTPLQNDILLGQIGLKQRLTEMEFFIPAPDIAPDAFHDLLFSLGYEIPRLNAARIRGYLKGFIDLVFEHDGRFYILDWKSNHLGHEATDYVEPSIAQAMAEHGYHLQYLLYAVALNRYLARRIANYDYDRHFGGVLYLFVRGVRPSWKDAHGNPCGSYFHRPSRTVIDRLDAALNGLTAGQFSLKTDSESLTAC